LTLRIFFAKEKIRTNCSTYLKKIRKITIKLKKEKTIYKIKINIVILKRIKIENTINIKIEIDMQVISVRKLLSI